MKYLTAWDFSDPTNMYTSDRTNEWQNSGNDYWGWFRTTAVNVNSNNISVFAMTAEQKQAAVSSRIELGQGLNHGSSFRVQARIRQGLDNNDRGFSFAGSQSLHACHCMCSFGVWVDMWERRWDETNERGIGNK